MSTEETAWQAGESAASALGPEADLFASADAAGLGGGHIAGIVNPPGPKAWYEAGDYAGASPDTWRAAASKHKGSWWEDWTAWSDARAGAHVKPPPLGSKRHPALGDAPGEYVRG